MEGSARSKNSHLPGILMMTAAIRDMRPGSRSRHRFRGLSSGDGNGSGGNRVIPSWPSLQDLHPIVAALDDCLPSQ